MFTVKLKHDELTAASVVITTAKSSYWLSLYTRQEF